MEICRFCDKRVREPIHTFGAPVHEACFRIGTHAFVFFAEKKGLSPAQRREQEDEGT